MHTVDFEGSAEHTPAYKMRVGEVGVGGDGDVLLRTYAGIVSLDDPRDTWTVSSSGPKFPVRRLRPGEKITLTIGEVEE